jgi:YD repeat-containing protein
MGNVPDMEAVVTRIVISAFALALLLCAMSLGTAAQSNPNCMATQQFCPGCGDPGIGFFNCVSEGSFLDVCQVMTPACAPAAAPAETCPGCAKAAASNPINLAIGNTYIEEMDVRLPGLSGGLALKRTWNSLWPSSQSALQIGLFGPNWRSTFEERVFVGSDNYIKYARGDGSFWSFGYNGGSWSVAAPANVVATLVTGTNWTLTFQNGEQRVFNGVSGKLTTIIDRNGNTTQLSYDTLGRLVTVTDPVSRHLYFAYSGSGYLVTGVTSDVGLTLSYSYDTQGRLSLVTNPDLSTLSFAYNSQSLISSVTDSNGKILESHTYDSNGRGLTSSRANGVEAVTITYPN